MNLDKCIALACITTLAWIPAHPEAKDLKRSLPASGGYFDAHTHWPNGILAWQDCCKMLPGHQTKEDQDLVYKDITQATPVAILQQKLKIYR